MFFFQFILPRKDIFLVSLLPLFILANTRSAINNIKFETATTLEQKVGIAIGHK